jgi:hypothetical protein
MSLSGRARLKNARAGAITCSSAYLMRRRPMCLCRPASPCLAWSWRAFASLGEDTVAARGEEADGDDVGLTIC